MYNTFFCTLVFLTFFHFGICDEYDDNYDFHFDLDESGLSSMQLSPKPDRDTQPISKHGSRPVHDFRSKVLFSHVYSKHRITVPTYEPEWFTSIPYLFADEFVINKSEILDISLGEPRLLSPTHLTHFDECYDVYKASTVSSLFSSSCPSHDNCFRRYQIQLPKTSIFSDYFMCVPIEVEQKMLMRYFFVSYNSLNTNRYRIYTRPEYFNSVFGHAMLCYSNDQCSYVHSVCLMKYFYYDSNNNLNHPSDFTYKLKGGLIYVTYSSLKGCSISHTFHISSYKDYFPVSIGLLYHDEKYNHYLKIVSARISLSQNTTFLDVRSFRRFDDITSIVSHKVRSGGLANNMAYGLLIRTTFTDVTHIIEIKSYSKFTASFFHSAFLGVVKSLVSILDDFLVLIEPVVRAIINSLLKVFLEALLYVKTFLLSLTLPSLFFDFMFLSFIFYCIFRDYLITFSFSLIVLSLRSLLNN